MNNHIGWTRTLVWEFPLSFWMTTQQDYKCVRLNYQWQQRYTGMYGAMRHVIVPPSLLSPNISPIVHGWTDHSNRVLPWTSPIAWSSRIKLFRRSIFINNWKWISPSILASFQINPIRTRWDTDNSLKVITICPKRKSFGRAFDTANGCKATCWNTRPRH